MAYILLWTKIYEPAEPKAYIQTTLHLTARFMRNRCLVWTVGFALWLRSSDVNRKN